MEAWTASSTPPASPSTKSRKSQLTTTQPRTSSFLTEHRLPSRTNFTKNWEVLVVRITTPTTTPLLRTPPSKSLLKTIFTYVEVIQWLRLCSRVASRRVETQWAKASPCAWNRKKTSCMEEVHSQSSPLMWTWLRPMTRARVLLLSLFTKPIPSLACKSPTRKLLSFRSLTFIPRLNTSNSFLTKT